MSRRPRAVAQSRYPRAVAHEPLPGSGAGDWSPGGYCGCMAMWSVRMRTVTRTSPGWRIG